MIDQIFRWLTELSNEIKGLLQNLLEYTLFRANPELAIKYGEALTTLISLTAVYLVLAHVSSLKKLVGIILASGWLMFIVAIGTSSFFP